MANLITAPTFFPRRLSQYVPAMQYASDVNISGETRISFGTPAAALATFLGTAINVAAAVVTPASALGNNATIVEPYGRNITVVLSGAGTGTVIVDGYDYLGQPMSENFALNGATPVAGKKAFKTIRQITTPTVGAVTMNVGVGLTLGLPYKVGRVTTEEFAQLPVLTLGTIVIPDLTVPATATTGDPRGTYTPQSTLNGTSLLTATYEFYSDVDALNNGGLHGVPHYSN
jgi:hypothetical protein